MPAAHAHHHTPVEHEHADSWHHHDLSAEGMPQQEHASIANPLALFAVFLIMVVVTGAIVWIVQTYYYQQVTGVGGLMQMQDKESMLRLAAEAQAYSQESERSLANYEWVNPEAGTVSIPMETAFDRIVQKYSATAVPPASGK